MDASSSDPVHLAIHAAAEIDRALESLSDLARGLHAAGLEMQLALSAPYVRTVAAMRRARSMLVVGRCGCEEKALGVEGAK